MGTWSGFHIQKLQADECVLDPSVDSKLKALVANAQEALTKARSELNKYPAVNQSAVSGALDKHWTIVQEHTTASGKCPESALQLGREIRKKDDKRVRQELLWQLTQPPPQADSVNLLTPGSRARWRGRAAMWLHLLSDGGVSAARQCANRPELVPVRRVRIGSSRLACSGQGNRKAFQFVRSLIGGQETVLIRVNAW